MSTRTVVPTASDHDMVIAVLGHQGETVGFLNLGDASDDNLLTDLRDGASQGISVYGFAEASDRLRLFDRFRTSEPWRDWYFGRPVDVRAARAVPIAWDGHVWRDHGGRAVVALDRTWVGPKGAGPTYAKPKVINTRLLEHRETKVPVTFMCTHAIPSVTRKGLPRAERRARRRHYRAHMHAIAELVRETDTAVVVMGDFNAPSRFNLLHPLRRAGLKGWTREGTHGNRAIDHVLTRDAR